MAYDEADGTGGARQPSGGAVLPELDARIELAGHPWRVVRARVVEALSALTECAVEAAVALDESVEPAVLLGLDASLTLSRAGADRRFAGVVTAVHDLGVTADQRVFAIELRPALWTLGQRRQHRVFQDTDALSIVREVLSEAELYDGEALDASLLVSGQYPPREYCVQYGETDLAFVTRLLEDEGVGFAFVADDGGERLVLFDGARRGAFPGTDPGAPAWVVMGDGGATASAETLRRWEPSRAVRPTGVTLRDWDFTHPSATADTPSRQSDDRRVLHEYPGSYTLGVYDPGTKAYGTSNAGRVAGLRSEAERVGSRPARGEGNVSRFAPGLTVKVSDAGRPEHDGPWFVTRVEHGVEHPEVLYSDANARGEDRYRNRFEAIPAAVPWRPERGAAKPVAASVQSAIVEAEPGSGEEIYTDPHGRVLVRFHWDRSAARTEPQRSKRASCWVRVAQSWAGAGWGAVFIPRVGTEVVVSFLDGDPDRPVVTGCLYHGAMPLPVQLPEHRTQSVLRTYSSPQNGGYNELRFEDRADEELVYLRAQRDLLEQVLRDRTREVGRHESVTVRENQAISVGKDRSITVEGGESHAITGARTRTVGGNDLTEVDGTRSVIVHKAASVHTDAHWRLTADEAARVEVGGSSGSATEVLPDKMSAKSPKRATLTVGDKGARAVMEPEKLAIELPEGVVLKCGDTRIEMEKDKIVLKTKSGAMVELDGSDITVKAGGTLTLKGSTIKGNG